MQCCAFTGGALATLALRHDDEIVMYQPYRPRLTPILLSAALAGCSLLKPSPQQRAERIEPMLSAAGFSMRIANTPDKLDHLKSLPQLQVKYYPDEAGRPKYWMADAQFCQCLYLGDEPAYQKYQDLRLQQRMAEEQRAAAQEQEMAAQQYQMEMMTPWVYGPVW